MKKQIMWMVLVLLILSAANAAAYDFKSGSLCYTIVSKTEHTVEVSYSQSKLANKVVVPSEVTHQNRKWKVIGLGADAFYGCKKMTELVLPASIKYIAGGALEECHALRKLTLPGGVTLRNYALRNCGIQNLRVPGSAKWSGRFFAQLANIPKVTSIVLEEGVEKIPDAAFQYDTKLEFLTLPTSLKYIGRYAFVGCESLRRLDIPRGVVSMGRLVDFGELNLQEIHVHWTEPISIAANTFPLEVYEKAVLYIPKETKWKYRASVGWSRFRNIEEME